MNGIAYADALKLIEAGIAWCKENNLYLAVAVVDAGGHPVAMGKCDEASVLAGEAVIQKARAAIWTGGSTSRMVKIGKDWPHVYMSFAMASQGQITLSMGGYVLVKDGQVVGGVGSAGGTGEQDETCSKVAAAAGGFETR